MNDQTNEPNVELPAEDSEATDLLRQALETGFAPIDRGEVS